MSATQEKPASEQTNKELLQEVKKALSQGTVEVDSHGNIVTQSSVDENPEQTARRTKLEKARTWYTTTD